MFAFSNYCTVRDANKGCQTYAQMTKTLEVTKTKLAEFQTKVIGIASNKEWMENDAYIGARKQHNLLKQNVGSMLTMLQGMNQQLETIWKAHNDGVTLTDPETSEDRKAEFADTAEDRMDFEAHDKINVQLADLSQQLVEQEIAYETLVETLEAAKSE